MKKKKKKKKRKNKKNERDGVEVCTFNLSSLRGMLTMAGMEAVIGKTVGALSDVRDAMNKLQSDAEQTQQMMSELVKRTIQTRVEMLKMEREAGAVRRELDQLRAEVAEMKRKERFRELVAQEARLVFSDAGDVRRRAAREAAFEG